MVSLWVNHFQIPTSTLTSTELNGGNVVHDSYHGGTNNTCLSLYTVIEEYGFPGDHVWFSQDMDGVSPNRVMWEFLPRSVRVSMAFLTKPTTEFRCFQCLLRTSCFSETLASVQPRITCTMSKVFWFGPDAWVRTDQSMDLVTCPRAAICCGQQGQPLRL